MARQIVVEIIGDNKRYTKALDGATGSTGKFGKSFDITKGLILGGAGLIGTALLAIGKETFELGAKYESMDNKAKTVFGGSLDIVKKWADANAKAMGLTSREAVGLATNMADLLIPMGFSRDAAAEMATNTTNLAGALAEWSGGTKSATEVSDILTKAMLGERDGLKALGISITEADVKQQLMKNGTQKLTGAALEQAKAIATQELILAKSADAQDAYAKGGDKGARSQAEFNATINTVKETLVTALYPILKTVAKWLADNLPGAIAAAQRGFQKIRPVIETVIAVIGKVASVVIPILQTAVTVLGNVFSRVFGAIVSIVRGSISTATNVINTLKTVFTNIGNFANSLERNIKGAFNNIVSFIRSIPGRITSAAAGMFNGILSAFKGAINSIIRGWNSLQFTVPSIDLGPLGRVGGFTLGTPNIPYLHAGGIVPGVPGSDVPAILQAGERVIPRKDANRGDININIGTFIGSGSDIDRLADLLAQRMRLAGV